MDGGSRDGSPDIIRKYENRLKGWVSEPDSGQADAINKGFARCSGDIFAWINSDDYYLPDAFQNAAAFFAAHPEIDLVYGDVISIDEAGKLINVMRFAPYDWQDLANFHIISQPGVFFRRKAWERAGGLDLSYRLMLDHDLWIRMMLSGKMAYLPLPLAAARYHADAKNRSLASEFGSEAFQIAESLAEKGQGAHRKMWGGAHLLDAAYLSQAGSSWKALKQYCRAFRLDPRRTLRDWRRIMLTIAAAVNPELAENVYRNRLRNRSEKFKNYLHLLNDPQDQIR